MRNYKRKSSSGLFALSANMYIPHLIIAKNTIKKFLNMRVQNTNKEIFTDEKAVKNYNMSLQKIDKSKRV